MTPTPNKGFNRGSATTGPPAPSPQESTWSGPAKHRRHIERSNRITGIILAGAVGPAFLVVGGGVFGGLFAVGKGKTKGCNITGDISGDDAQACEDRGHPYIVASFVVLGVMGTTGLIFIFAGATMAQRAHSQMMQGSYDKRNRGTRLELVGFAPLTDRESKPSGLAMQWEF
jgi:hypothetical protein